MAIFHLRTKIIGRSSHNTISAVAYRGGVELFNDETGEVFDYSKKAVAEVELLLSEKVPSWAKDMRAEIAKDRGEGLQKLVHVVESFEKRKDAQVWREVEFSLPRELSDAQGLELAREYLSDQFCREGMGVLLNAHMDVDSVTGDRKPHVHALIFMREMTEEGFGKKVREWNDRGLHERWREQLAAYTNFHLKMHGIDQRIDHRSYADRGIDIIPQPKLGKNVVEMERRGGRSVHTPFDAAVTDKGRAYQSDYLKNVYKVVSNPGVVLDMVTAKQSTFVWSDVQKVLHRYVDDIALFQKLDQKLQLSPELVVLNGGGDKPPVYTTKSYAENERSLETVSQILGGRDSHPVGEGVLSSVVEKTDRELRASFGTGLSEDQKGALSHMCSEDQISCVVGYAGAGKTTVLLAAKEAYEKSGYRVYGLAPTGKAAQNLEGEGLSSETLFKFLRDFEAGRSQYDSNSVIVLDEGGMVPVSQMKDFLSAVNTLGVKAVIVGDGAQLQPIEAGAAFRKVAEQVGSFKLEHVVRQKEEWQREATKAFGRQVSAVALQSYAEKGCISIVSGKEGLSGTVLAKQQMLEDWKSSVQLDKSSLMMASSRAEVSSLNEMARHHLQREGRVEKESFIHQVSRPMSDDFGRYIKDAEVGERAFAKGDQIIFLRNDRSLGVKNGHLATITNIDRNKIEAQLLGVKGGDGKPQTVSFATNLYNAIDYGWASTIHKNQGSTVDCSYYLASSKDSRNLAYVAMSRHRESVQVYGAKEEFQNEKGLIRSLSQSNEKLLASDYVSSEKMSDLYREDRNLLSKSFETLENHWTAMKVVGSEKIQELKEQYLGEVRSEKEHIDIRSYFKDREGERARDVLNLDMPSQEIKTSLEKGAELVRSEFRERIDLDRINDCLKAEARTVASSLLGEPNKALSSSKELRYGAKGSLCVSVSGSAAGQWFDFEKGEGGNLLTLIQQTKGTDFKETLRIADDLTQGRARDLVPVTSQESKPKELSLAESQERQEKIEKAQALYEKTSPCVEGTYAEAYLDIYRDIRTYPGDDVRSGTAYDKGTNQEYNTLVAFLRNGQGEITGGQTIYLDKEGKKADISVNKRSFGVIKGSVVTLQEDENKTGRTFMAEGIETALSIKEAGFEGKIVATLGIHNFKNYEPSQSEKQIIICGDHDGKDSASTKVLDNLEKVLQGKSQDYMRVQPSKEGHDFNDVLKEDGKEGVIKTFKEVGISRAIGLEAGTIPQIALESQEFYKITGACVDGTFAEGYLSLRKKINGYPGDDIRSGKLQDPLSDKSYNTLVAFARDKEGEITGGQITFLDERAYKVHIQNNPRVFGMIEGSSVLIQSDEKGSGRTFLTDSVENGLTIKEAGFEGKIVSCLSYENFKSYESSSDEKHIVLCLPHEGKISFTKDLLEDYHQDLQSKGIQSSFVEPELSGQQFTSMLEFNGVNSVVNILENQGISKIASEDVSKVTPTETLPKEIDYQEEVSKMGKIDFAVMLRKNFDSIEKSYNPDEIKVYEDKIKGYTVALQESRLYESFKKDYNHLLNKAESLVEGGREKEQEKDRGYGMDM